MRLEAGLPARFCVRFAVACALLYCMLELTPDSLYFPLNRLNTVLAAKLLDMLGFAVQSRGLLIAFEGFQAQVIGECSAVFLSVLPVAFIWAYPTAMRARLIGWIVGMVLLFIVNLIRIDLLVLTDARASRFFEPVHLYGAQVVMILTVLAICLGWVGWQRGDWSAKRFGAVVLRFVLISVIAFAGWWLFSGPYIGLMYRTIHFGLAWLDIPVDVPVSLRVYPDTFKCFNWVTFSALAWSFGDEPYKMRIRFWLQGLVLLSGLHALFTLLQVLFIEYPRLWLVGVINLVLVLNEWVLPFGMWLVHKRKALTASPPDGMQKGPIPPLPA